MGHEICRSNCDEEIGSLLRQHYQRPYFLPATAETEKTDWIFMGSHGYGAPMHVGGNACVSRVSSFIDDAFVLFSPFCQVDDVEHPSWQAQIKGEKLWILDPPRECHYACNRLEVVVHPGEISKTFPFRRSSTSSFNSRSISSSRTVVLDTNRWYHQTVIVSEEMSITIGAEYDWNGETIVPRLLETYR